MRCSPILASVAALAVNASNVHADFEFVEDGSYHISASVSDFSGSDSFNWVGVLFPTEFHSDSDNAVTPGDWSNAGSAVLVTITPTLIDLRGFTEGGTPLESATISALAEVSFTFTIETARLVSWDYFTLTDPGTSASVSLTGPNGLVGIGVQTLVAGEYTITASAGFADLGISASDETIFSRFALTLEQVPAPGAAALFAVAGLMTRSRRRQ